MFKTFNVLKGTTPKCQTKSLLMEKKQSSIDFTVALRSDEHLSGTALTRSGPTYLLYILKYKYLILQIVSVSID